MPHMKQHTQSKHQMRLTGHR